NNLIPYPQISKAKRCFLLHSHRLRQIPWLIYVAATRNCSVIGEQLQGNDCQQGTQLLKSGGYVEHIVGVLAYVLVSLRCYHYYTSIAGVYFLHIADYLFIDMRSSCYCNQWGIWIEQGNRTVL